MNPTIAYRQLIYSVAIGALSCFVCSSCGQVADERIASGLSVSTSGTDEEIIAAFMASSNSPQVLGVQSGSLAGSSVVIPPGSLNIDLSVTVTSTQSIANSNQAAELGISNVAISPAGPSVLISPSTKVELAVPMQLSIPVSSTTNLALTDSTDNYVVIYQGYAVSDGAVTNRSGLIPRSEIVIQNGFAKFKTTKFGIFQVAKTSTKIEQVIETDSKTDLANLPGAELVGKWSRCQANYNGASMVEYYELELITFEKYGAINHSSQRFAAANINCTGSPTSSETESGFYSVGNIVPDILPASTVREIDISLKSETKLLLGIYYIESTSTPTKLHIEANDDALTERPDAFSDTVQPFEKI